VLLPRRHLVKIRIVIYFKTPTVYRIGGRIYVVLYEVYYSGLRILGRLNCMQPSRLYLGLKLLLKSWKEIARY
jgi:hypothetical protein